jgi:chromosome partitioning protein
MKTISVSLQKGGTGKTSLSVSLAAELARLSGKAIVIDCDPQGSATAWLKPGDLESELADILTGETKTPEVILHTEFPGLDLIPTAGLGGGLKIFSDTTAYKEHFCMADLADTLEALGYHFVVFDLSPGWGGLERAAAIASAEIITPVMPDFFGMDGLGVFYGNLAELRKSERLGNDKPLYNKIIINALDNRIAQHIEAAGKIREREKTYKVYTVPVDPIFRKAQAAACTIQSLTGAKPETIQELNRLANDIIGA